jgi:hypothetical protein
MGIVQAKTNPETQGSRACVARRASALTIRDWVFVAVCLGLFLFWAVAQGFDYGPDESSRLLIPEYILLHGVLPTGSEAAIRLQYWGYSYGYTITWLPYLLEALFMNITALFTTNTTALLVGARLTSVLAGTLTTVMVIKASRRLFGDSPWRWVMVILICLMPQFVFLSSYTNNDMVSVFGVSLIFYSWIRCRDEGVWSKSTCALMAIGIIVCVLSYYFSYAWVLFSIVFFFVSNAFMRTKPLMLLKRTALIVVVVMLVLSPFLVRNAMLYGADDVLAMHATDASAELYADKDYQPESHVTPSNLGYSIVQAFLLPTHYSSHGIPWLGATFGGAICNLGYMDYSLPRYMYLPYILLFVTGAFGALLHTIVRARDTWRARRLPSLSRRPIQEVTEGPDLARQRHVAAAFYLCVCAGILLTLSLSMYHSYSIDYQPQGRYLYSALIPSVYLLIKGIEFLFGRLKPLKQRMAAAAVCCFLVGVTVYVTFFIFLPTAQSTYRLYDSTMITEWEQQQSAS